MKRKGICFAGIALACILAGCGTSARTISVDDITGQAIVENKSGSHDAYVEEHLISGDAVSVMENSELLLLLDQDKHVYADANTHFSLEATGKEGSSKTKIVMHYGTVLCGIDNKLGDSESFEVETQNSLMAVRGTVFTVTYTETDGEPVTTVKVKEGVVEATYERDGEKVVEKIGAGYTLELIGKEGDIRISYDKEGLIEVTGTVYLIEDYFRDEMEEVIRNTPNAKGGGYVFVPDTPIDGVTITDVGFIGRSSFPEIPANREAFAGRRTLYGELTQRGNETWGESDIVPKLLGSPVNAFVVYRYE